MSVCVGVRRGAGKCEAPCESAPNTMRRTYYVNPVVCDHLKLPAANWKLHKTISNEALIFNFASPFLTVSECMESMRRAQPALLNQFLTSVCCLGLSPSSDGSSFCLDVSTVCLSQIVINVMLPFLLFCMCVRVCVRVSLKKKNIDPTQRVMPQGRNQPAILRPGSCTPLLFSLLPSPSSTTFPSPLLLCLVVISFHARSLLPTP